MPSLELRLSLIQIPVFIGGYNNTTQSALPYLSEMAGSACQIELEPLYSIGKYFRKTPSFGLHLSLIQIPVFIGVLFLQLPLPVIALIFYYARLPFAAALPMILCKHL